MKTILVLLWLTSGVCYAQNNLAEIRRHKTDVTKQIWQLEAKSKYYDTLMCACLAYSPLIGIVENSMDAYSDSYKRNKMELKSFKDDRKAGVTLDRYDTVKVIAALNYSAMSNSNYYKKIPSTQNSYLILTKQGKLFGTNTDFITYIKILWDKYPDEIRESFDSFFSDSRNIELCKAFHRDRINLIFDDSVKEYEQMLNGK
jgi:hypothetical protein